MKRNSVKTLVLIFGITVLALQSSYAQPSNRERGQEPPSFKELLKMMDENEDGKLEKSEVKGPLKEMFAKIDEDEDGFLTEEELKKAPKPKRRQRN